MPPQAAIYEHYGWFECHPHSYNKRVQTIIQMKGIELNRDECHTHNHNKLRPFCLYNLLLGVQCYIVLLLKVMFEQVRLLWYIVHSSFNMWAKDFKTPHMANIHWHLTKGCLHMINHIHIYIARENFKLRYM